MKAFLDTSVLIATFYADHQHHFPSAEVFFRFGKKKTCCAVHSLAEVYATLTRMPPPRRLSGEQALLFLADIRANLSVVALETDEYFQMLHSAGGAGLAGGAIYDALLGHCALKARAETIYTWNTKDFLRLPEAISRRVRTP